MFWAYGTISRLERICINSFLANHYDVFVWTYGHIENLPNGSQQRDARDIIDEKNIFTYRNGSYAGFSNLFRYKLLSTIGGLYADTDVICMLPSSHLGYEPFLVEQRAANEHKVNCNLIYNPQPAPGDIIDLALALTERFPVSSLNWGDCGPKLITSLVNMYPQLAPEIKPPDYANSIDWNKCPDELLMPGRQLSPDSKFLHCYNEMWRRAGIDKDAPYPEGSIIAQLAQQYSVHSG